jgi:branched-chain amino acid transport system permease protein
MKGKLNYNLVVALVLLVVAALLPLFLQRTSGGKYNMIVLTYAMIWAVAASSLNLVLGYTGQACLAHGAFVGIGAYSLAIMVDRVGINYWLALPLTCLLTALIGCLIGLPSFRTRGPYFAIVTLCFNVIVYAIFENWTWLSGGYAGQPLTVPAVLSGRLARYYLVLAFLVLTLLVLRQIVKSIVGASFLSILSNEGLSEAVGISAFRYKLLSFTVSCFLAGLAGALFATASGRVDSSITSYLHSFYLLIYVLIGGVATLAGPVLGAVGLYFLLDRIKGLGEFRYVGFGILLILIIIYFPRGLVGGVNQLREWMKERRSTKTSPREEVAG